MHSGIWSATEARTALIASIRREVLLELNLTEENCRADPSQRATVEKLVKARLKEKNLSPLRKWMNGLFH